MYTGNKVKCEFVEDLARKAGEICLTERHRLDGGVEYKGPLDLVTKVDRMVEEFLIGEIRTAWPEDGLWGEESGRSEGKSGNLWVIDPIDGTNSYIQNLPGYTISIAMQRDGETELGVVYAPVLKEMFRAEKGKGAYLNGKEICVSDTSKLMESVLATGFACLRAGLENNNLAAFNRVMTKIRDIRRHGSAALDLAYVAAGRFDGFWELNLNQYDVAAGALIVQEAGGNICDLKGGEKYPEEGIVATNGRLTKQLLELL